MKKEHLDQTRGESIPFISGAQAAPLSQNVAAALCMKAARGAGKSWGLAEATGYAASWLVQHGFDGPEHLYRHITQAQGWNWSDLCPSVTLGDWQAPVGRALCPIALGATLCDYAGLPEGAAAGCSIRIGPVDHPVLLIPFLATIAESAGLVFSLELDGRSARIGADRAALEEAVAALNGVQISLVLTGQSGTPQRAITAPAPNTAAQTIAALNTMAMRTTVASSEASRSGAGSTKSDND